MNEIDYKVSKTESRYCSNIVLLNKRLESFMCFRGCTKFRWASVYHWRPLITMKSSIKPSIVAIGSGRQATRARGSSTGLTDTSSTSLAPLRHLSASGPFRWAGFSRFLFLSFFLSFFHHGLVGLWIRDLEPYSVNSGYPRSLTKVGFEVIFKRCNHKESFFIKFINVLSFTWSNLFV